MSTGAPKAWSTLRAHIAQAARRHLKTLRQQLAKSEGIRSLLKNLSDADRALLPKHQRKFARTQAVAEERERRAAEEALNSPAQGHGRQQMRQMNERNRQFWQEREAALDELKRSYPDEKAYELVEAAGTAVDALTRGQSKWGAMTRSLDVYEKARRSKRTQKATQGKSNQGADTLRRVRDQTNKLLRANPHLSRNAIAKKLPERVKVRDKHGTWRPISEDYALKLLKRLRLPPAKK